MANGVDATVIMTHRVHFLHTDIPYLDKQLVFDFAHPFRMLVSSFFYVRSKTLSDILRLKSFEALVSVRLERNIVSNDRCYPPVLSR